MLTQTTGGYLIFTTLRVVVNTNYWWIPYIYNVERGC
jgi:hypothetical protein